MKPTTSLTVHILAAVAEHEREMISQRTRAALAAAKARGVVLGNPGNLTPQGRTTGALRGIETRGKQARARAADVLPVIEAIRAEGVASLNGIASALNERSVPAPRGGQWRATQVQRTLAQVAGSY